MEALCVASAVTKFPTVTDGSSFAPRKPEYLRVMPNIAPKSQLTGDSTITRQSPRRIGSYRAGPTPSNNFTEETRCQLDRSTNCQRAFAKKRLIKLIIP